MIRFEQVGKRYANGHVGLHELSFRVRRGEFLFVTGHSGAGKSTLLRLLLAMERPTTGKLLLAGQDLATISNSQIPFLRRQIGVVFQNHQLLFERLAPKADPSIQQTPSLFGVTAPAPFLSPSRAFGGTGRAPLPATPETRK